MPWRVFLFFGRDGSWDVRLSYVEVEEKPDVQMRSVGAVCYINSEACYIKSETWKRWFVRGRMLLADGCRNLFIQARAVAYHSSVSLIG